MDLQVAKELAFIIPALWVLGAFLKHTPKVPNSAIIWTILLVSVILCFFTVGLSVIGFVQGFIAAGIAVFAHQLIKQTK